MRPPHEPEFHLSLRIKSFQLETVNESPMPGEYIQNNCVKRGRDSYPLAAILQPMQSRSPGRPAQISMILRACR